MKKITLLFLLISSFASAQRSINPIGFPGNGLNYNVTQVGGNTVHHGFVDTVSTSSTCGHLFVVFTDNSTQDWGYVKGLPGEPGKDGFSPQLVQGNSYEINPDSLSHYTLRDLQNGTYAIDLYIAPGKDGINGTNGSGTSNYKYYSPAQFYTGDWGAAIQKCIDSACVNRYPIITTGTYHCETRQFTFPKLFEEITWYGTRTKIYCKGFTRPRPTTLSESQQQQNTKYNVFDVYIIGDGTGVGWEPAANSNSIFSNMTIENFGTAAIFRTTQNGNIWCWSINTCTNGISIGAENNNGIDYTKSQSNDTKCWFPRVYGGNLNMNICFGAYGSFGCDVMYPEMEGNGKVFRCFDVDTYLNNTVKGINIVCPHFEFVQGISTDGAMARIRSSSGVFKIIGANHDVGPLSNMIMVDAYSSTGLSMIKVIDVSKWEHTGPIFKNDNCRWKLESCSEIIPWSAGNNPTQEDNIKNLLFTGTPVTYANGNKVWGYNYFDFSW